MSQKTLSEALGSNLIFTRIMSQHVTPWVEDSSITGALLDFEYNYNFSGDKLIAPTVKKNLGTDGKITTEAFNNLCDIVWMMYGQKWARLWEVQTAEFDPIENYSMTEKEETKYGKVDTNSGTDSTLRTGTDTNTESGTNTLLMTGTDTHALSGKDTVKNTGTDNVVNTGSQANVRTGSEALAKAGTETDSHTGGYTDTNNSLATEHEVSAFNSSGYSDASKDTTTGNVARTYNSDNVAKSFTNRTDTTTYNNVTDTTTFNSVTNAETKNLQDETTYGKQDQETRNMSDATTFGHVNTENRNMTDALTHGHVVTASGKDERELTRTGNIGTTTSQQMLESSLELWKWNFFCDIFKDVDSIFTLSVY